MEDVVEVMVIATGFDMQAIDAQLTASAHHQTSASYPSQMPAHSVHSPAQQALARTSNTSNLPNVPTQRANQNQPRTVLSRPARGVESAPRHSSMPEPAPARAFGASAIHDEAVLDIPAYLRRSRG